MVIVIKLDLEAPKRARPVREDSLGRRLKSGDDHKTPLQLWLDEGYSRGPWNPIFDARLVAFD
jgi:hypothetical protein